MKVNMKRPSAKPNGQSAPEASCPPLALRLREAARALGISPRHLWALAKNGDVPCCRIGNGRRKLLIFPYDQLQRWLSERAAQRQ
jgi:excisionase family DNA binding protein